MVDEHNFEENDLRELFANIKEERKLKKFFKKLPKDGSPGTDVSLAKNSALIIKDYL